MNKDLIFQNLETIRRFLNLNTSEFSVKGGRSKSYYRNNIRENKLPDLDFIVSICFLVNITVDAILSSELELKIVYEE